jgi:hypothetical protein
MQEREGLEGAEHGGEVEEPTFGSADGCAGGGGRSFSDEGVHALGEEEAG